MVWELKTFTGPETLDEDKIGQAETVLEVTTGLGIWGEIRGEVFKVETLLKGQLWAWGGLLLTWEEATEEGTEEEQAAAEFDKLGWWFSIKYSV